MSRTVLITGTSIGIGEVTAQYFLKQGWNVATTVRSPKKVGAWSRSQQAIVLPLDVTDGFLYPTPFLKRRILCVARAFRKAMTWFVS